MTFWKESFHQICFFENQNHFKIWCVVKKLIQNLTLFSKSSIQKMFFVRKTSLSGSSFLEKPSLMFLRCKLINKLIFWKQFIQQQGIIQKQFHLNTYGVFEIPVQNLIEGQKNIIQSLTSSKNSNSKIAQFFKIGWNYDTFSKSWFKAWPVVKKLPQNLILLKTFD